MNKLKCLTIKEGPIPSEKTVTVLTSDGIAEEVIVAREQADGGCLLVWPIGMEGSKVLVELPRESSSGFWRLWINKENLELAS